MKFITTVFLFMTAYCGAQVHLSIDTLSINRDYHLLTLSVENDSNESIGLYGQTYRLYSENTFLIGIESLSNDYEVVLHDIRHYDDKEFVSMGVDFKSGDPISSYKIPKILPPGGGFDICDIRYKVIQNNLSSNYVFCREELTSQYQTAYNHVLYESGNGIESARRITYNDLTVKPKNQNPYFEIVNNLNIGQFKILIYNQSVEYFEVFDDIGTFLSKIQVGFNREIWVDHDWHGYVSICGYTDLDNCVDCVKMILIR